MTDAGIHNYSIWKVGDELFGYYECPDVQKAAQSQAESEVVARWNESMKGILEMCCDPQTGEVVNPEMVFLHS